jgi:phosphopantothenoylcysteine decarboxylase/phosphopantothenate--cysteine ligase
VQNGFEVEVVMSQSALRFIGAATFEGLTGKRVHTDLYESGRAMAHINLMRWCDLAIVCPASANTIAKMAQGLGDDLISTMFLAHDFSKPYLIAPAMNVAMYRHPATQANLAKLRQFGVMILDSANGRLACGEVGEGRLLEPEEIVREIEMAIVGQGNSENMIQSRTSDETLATKDNSAPMRANAKRVLITSGGTREAIDGVRYIGNTSSGRTGTTLAEELSGQGFEVTLLRAENSVAPSSSAQIRAETFKNFKSLQQKLETELRLNDYDFVVHAAAVSDYSLNSIADAAGKKIDPSGKIDSMSEEIVFSLKKNPKLVDSIKSASKNRDVKLVAFKLTNTALLEEQTQAVHRLSQHAHPDWIIHNDMKQIESGEHRFNIYEGATPSLKRDAVGAKALAKELSHLFSQGGQA